MVKYSCSCVNSNLINKGEIAEVEAILIWNLNPDDYKQAIAFIPSLSVYGQGTVEKFIHDIKIRRGQK
jgi:hypothetical protein